MNSTIERYYVQSSQVRGEPRLYWIEARRKGGSFRFGRHTPVIEDFGTNRRKAEKRCEELNATLEQ